MSAGSVIAVVPAFNESKTVYDVVAGLLTKVSKVIVVDDGSADNTREQAERAGAVVLSNTGAKGYDGALNTGFAEAARLGAGIILSFDADGEHASEDVPRVLEPIISGKADVSLGQRPHITHLGEKIYALYTRLRWGIRDPLCGFKAYSAEAYRAVGHFDTVQSIGTELMLCAASRGFRLAFVPIELRERKDDSSRFYSRAFRANIKIIRAMLRVLSI